MAINLFTALGNALNPKPGQIPGTVDYGITELFGGGSNPNNKLTSNNPAVKNPIENPMAKWPQGNIAGLTLGTTNVNTGQPNSLSSGNAGGGTSGGASGGNVVVPTGGTGNPDDFMSQFEAALGNYYAPAYSRLDALEQSYNQQAPLAENQITTAYEAALNPVNERLAQGQANIATQRSDVESGKQSAISQARNLYNQLVQQGIARFGAGSSTGPAYSEIIGRQAMANMGQASNTAAKAQGSLDTELNNLTDFVNTQKTTLAKQKTDALGQVQQEFRDKIAAIQGQRGVLDQAKASQQIQALMDARDRAYQIEDAATAFQRQIDLFNAQKTTELANQYNVNKGISSDAITAFSKLAPIVGVQAAGQLSGVDLSQVQGQLTPYAGGTWTKLPDGSYYNNQTGQYIGAGSSSPADLTNLLNQQGGY